MKKNIVKKLVAGALAAVLTVGCLAGCGEKKESSGSSAGGSSEGASNADGGTIMFICESSTGVMAEGMAAYAESICNAYGYKFQIVYGDSFNDPAGNLKVVQDAMTDDVVGLVSAQDGGIANIMDAYPELYVAGIGSDMNSVFGEGDVATSAKCLTNEKFLGTIANGYVNGEDTGKMYFDYVMEYGCKKVAIMMFPAYAFPALAEGVEVFRQLVDEYNQTASDADKIEIVGDPEVLEFAPLEESYFLEKEHQDLDGIVAPLGGVDFIYPATRAAIDAGNCNKEIKLLTSGMTDDEAIVSEVGDGVIQVITVAPAENIAYPLTLLHKAISGEMYDDFNGPERIDSIAYVIDSKEDMDNVLTKSLNGTADPQYAQISVEDLEAVTSYADLKALMVSDQLKVDALADR